MHTPTHIPWVPEIYFFYFRFEALVPRVPPTLKNTVEKRIAKLPSNGKSANEH